MNYKSKAKRTLSRHVLIKKISLVSIFFFVSSGCDFNKLAEIKAPFKVRIPWKEKGATQFTLRDIELTTITQLSPLQGDAANLYVKPTISEYSISGSPFEIEYTYNNKKVVLPLNRLSSQALTLYAHMERLFLWSKQLNLPPELKSKLDVGLAAEFLINGVPMRTNALFSAHLNAMLVVPYNDDSLPLSLNGGVLAHEYFHSLFSGLVLKLIRQQEVSDEAQIRVDTEKLVSHENLFSQAVSDKPVSSTVDDIEKELQSWLFFSLLRGMNEGLADVWGWLYTEDTNFIFPSLPGVKEDRNLKFKPRSLWTKADMRNSISTSAKMGETAEGLAYGLGTEFARWFFLRIREIEGEGPLSDERRNFWSNLILDRLITYAQSNVDIKHPEKIVPSDFITHMVFGNDNLSASECENWMSFVEKAERAEAFARNCK